MQKRFVKKAETAEEKKFVVEYKMMTRRIDAARVPSPQTEISDDKVTKSKTYSTATSLDESDSRLYHTCRHEEMRRCNHTRGHHRSPTPLMHKLDNSQFSPNILIPVSEKYQKAVFYPSYHLIYKSRRYKEDVALKMQNIRKTIAV